MAATTVTLQGGLLFSGKTLTVPSGYTTAIDVASLSGGSITAKDGTTTDAGNAFSAAKVTMIDATKAGKISIVGGAKAAAISLSSAGGTIQGGSSGADKLYGNTGNDVFVLTGNKTSGGSDIIADTKTYNTAGFGSGDKIVLSGASTSVISSVTDNVTKNNVVLTLADKAKYTIYKKPNVPITVQGSDGSSFVYGVDGTKTQSTDGKTLVITRSATNGETFNASTLAAGVKTINATAATNAINIVGNGQNDVISIGSGGGTISGGSNGSRTTTDNLYGTTKTGGPVTFVIDTLSGSDNIYNYKDGDVISLGAGLSTLDFSSSAVVKDGGSGKDLAITYSGKNKVTIKQNTANKVTFNVNGTEQYYGVDLPTGVSLNSNRTALVVGATASSDEDSVIGIEGWNNDGYTGFATDTKLKEMAPKLNSIDASAAKDDFVLKGQATVASVLKGGTAKTTMIGGTAADQFTGGTGSDVFIVELASAGGGVGKDVINSIGAGDLIMVKGADTIQDSIDVAISSKGVVTFYSDTKSTEYKNNSITIKTFKQNTTNPVVVVNESGKVLAVNSANSVPGPIGLTSDSKGLTTDNTFDGNYAKGSYVKGSSVELETGKSEYEQLDGREYAAIDANNYGGSVKQIDAKTVSNNLTSVTITGNSAVKNTIYTPVRTSGKAITTDVYGGSAADNFYGDSSSTLTTVYFHTYVPSLQSIGKDVINNYQEGDVIVVHGLSSLSSFDLAGDGSGIISEKGSDVTFTFDKGNTLTIKNGATKKITIQDKDGYKLEYGHALPAGLEYDSKHTAINANATINSSLSAYVAADGYDKNQGIIDAKPIFIDLTETDPDVDVDVDDDGNSGFYYKTIKTVSLTAATSTEMPAYVSGNTLANEIYAPAGGGGFYGGKGGTKPDADKLYGNVGADTFYYSKGDGADVIRQQVQGKFHLRLE